MNPFRLKSVAALLLLALIATVAAIAPLAPARAEVLLLGRSTDTIDVAGQTVLGSAATYEAVVGFDSTFNAFGRLFNEWTHGSEDKQLRAGPTGAFGYNHVVGGVEFTAPISLGVMHHLAFVYDGSQQSLYLDGQLKVSVPASGGIGNNSGEPFVGAIFRDGTMVSSMIGYLDSLRISNVARYSGPSFVAPLGDLGNDAATLLLYNFDEPAGSTTVTDLSGNGHTGTLGIGFNGATLPSFLANPFGSVPEIDPAGMGSVLALVTGALGLLERRRRATVPRICIAVACLLVGGSSLHAGPVFDAAQDFSAMNNPNGVWQYGWSSTPGAAFTPYNMNFLDGSGLNVWATWPPIDGLSVTYNGTSSAIRIGDTIWAPGQLVFHPGSVGQNSVVYAGRRRSLVWSPSTPRSKGVIRSSARLPMSMYCATD